MSISDQVVAIIAAQALRDPAQLSAESTLDEIGLDSLGLVEAIFAIEEAFDISVPFNPNEPDAPSGFDVSNLGQIVKSIETLIGEKQI